MATYTRRLKIAGRNHILPPLGIAWKTKHGHDFFLCWCYVLSVTSKVLVPVKYLSSKIANNLGVDVHSE